MMLKELLQGKPLKHPLHPALVHFPIGLFVLSLLVDLSTFWGAGNVLLVRSASYLMALGLFMALVAAIPGLVDWADIRTDHPAKKTATYHMLLNLIVIILYAINVAMRYLTLEVATTPTAMLILSLVGVALLSVSGYLGGELVYGDGIGVGRHRRDTPTPRETIRVSAANVRDGLVPVITVDRLADCESVRVDLDGTIIVIAKVDDKFYAFQEFCPHRYGPLSEGHFHKGEVMCPWHGSCFDMRSGQVTQGPAKVDLKTYEVVTQQGMLHIRAPQEVRQAEREMVAEVAASR